MDVNIQYTLGTKVQVVHSKVSVFVFLFFAVWKKINLQSKKSAVENWLFPNSFLKHPFLYLGEKTDPNRKYNDCYQIVFSNIPSSI